MAVLGTLEIVLLLVLGPLVLLLVLCCVCWPCYRCFFGNCLISQWGGYDDGNIYDSLDHGIECGLPGKQDKNIKCMWWQVDQIKCINWHERRRCSRSPFRRLTGNDVSGPLFSSLFFFIFFHFLFIFFSSPSHTFLIDRLFEWKSVFSESCSERAKT